MTTATDDFEEGFQSGLERAARHLTQAAKKQTENTPSPVSDAIAKALKDEAAKVRQLTP